jgi:hypothetical protein
MLGRAKAKAKEGSLTPVGVNFLLVGYAYSDGDLSTSDSSPIEDAQLTMHTEILAYARSLDVWGKSGKFDVILPYTEGQVGEPWQ